MDILESTLKITSGEDTTFTNYMEKINLKKSDKLQQEPEIML